MSQPLEIQRLFLVFYAAQKTAAVKAKVKLSDQFGTILVMCDLCCVTSNICSFINSLLNIRAILGSPLIIMTFSGNNYILLFRILIFSRCFIACVVRYP